MFKWQVFSQSMSALIRVGWGLGWTFPVVIFDKYFCYICAITLNFFVFTYLFILYFFLNICSSLQQHFHPKLLSKIWSFIYLSICFFGWYHLENKSVQRGCSSKWPLSSLSHDALRFQNNINTKSFVKFPDSCALAGFINNQRNYQYASNRLL